jgi:hypothetical protein
MGAGVVLGGVEEDVVELAAQRVGTSLAMSTSESTTTTSMLCIKEEKKRECKKDNQETWQNQESMEHLCQSWQRYPISNHACSRFVSLLHSFLASIAPNDTRTIMISCTNTFL